MTEEQKEAYIGYDTQGWPIFKLKWKEILEMLGFTHENGLYAISDTNPLLESYPICLEDDGMGYGVNAKFVTEINSDGNVFIEPMHKGAENGPSFVVELEYDLEEINKTENKEKENEDK